MTEQGRKAIDTKKYQPFVSPLLNDEDKKKAERKKAIGNIEKMRPKRDDS